MQEETATLTQLSEREIVEVLRELTRGESEANELLAELRRHVEDLRYLMRIRQL